MSTFIVRKTNTDAAYLSDDVLAGYLSLYSDCSTIWQHTTSRIKCLSSSTSKAHLGAACSREPSHFLSWSQSSVTWRSAGLCAAASTRDIGFSRELGTARHPGSCAATGSGGLRSGGSRVQRQHMAWIDWNGVVLWRNVGLGSWTEHLLYRLKLQAYSVYDPTQDLPGCPHPGGNLGSGGNGTERKFFVVQQQRATIPSKAKHLIGMFWQSRRLANQLNVSAWLHHRRKYNKMAGTLANIAMDLHKCVQRYLSRTDGDATQWEPVSRTVTAPAPRRAPHLQTDDAGPQHREAASPAPSSAKDKDHQLSRKPKKGFNGGSVSEDVGSTTKKPVITKEVSIVTLVAATTGEPPSIDTSSDGVSPAPLRRVLRVLLVVRQVPERRTRTYKARILLKPSV
ncbi:hypothetical protein GQ600_22227 [Phytophthora cactorum]|nr:hypothetical protein GQ600_22227 [Phytophthora cactorum]